jgi:hypothetical protein
MAAFERRAFIGTAEPILMGAPAHDPEKHVLDLIGDGNRFSDKIMHMQNVPCGEVVP